MRELIELSMSAIAKALVGISHKQDLERISSYIKFLESSLDRKDHMIETMAIEIATLKHNKEIG